MTTVESLHRAFATRLDASVRVRVRRPGSLFQIILPAYMGDGDVAALYVRPTQGERLVVTDLGATRTRLSYLRKLTADLDEEVGQLAEHQGLTFEDGELRAEVRESDLLAATLGLLQVEAQADRLGSVSKRRAQEATEFREEVLALLRHLFEGKIQVPFYDKAADPEALYKVDALIESPRPLAVAVVSGDLEAERAVSAKLSLRDKALAKNTRWVAIPRDMERLTSKTRKRLTREYHPAASAFAEDREVVEERLRDLAAA